MELIRRAPHPFPEDRFPDNLGAVAQRTVARGEFPALFVIHDFENDWLIGGGDHDIDDAGIYHIRHVVDHDPTIEETAKLPVGFMASRSSIDEPWTFEKHIYARTGVVNTGSPPSVDERRCELRWRMW